MLGICLLALGLAVPRGSGGERPARAASSAHGTKARLHVIARGRVPLDEVDRHVNEVANVLATLLGKRKKSDTTGSVTVDLTWDPNVPPEGDPSEQLLMALTFVAPEWEDE
tara:strand:+ start:506 stop:838 length:333 start_codon:yes stop_codon:yes gene_type:complete